MAMNLPPVLRQRYLDANGNPLAGGKLYTYQAGTTTPQATYTDQGGGTPNANPIVLDANGEAWMWLDPSLSYKFVLKDSSDVTQWTVDNVVGLLTAGAVVTASIADGAVTTVKIADDAVTAAKLKDSASVDGDRAVTTDHIRDSAITTAKITDASVTRGKLASGAVGKISVAAKTAAYTLTDSDDLVEADATSAAFTLTLPSAATAGSGRIYEIIKTDTSFNAVTVSDGGSFSTTLNTEDELIRVRSNGTAWRVVRRDIPVKNTSFTPTLNTSTGVNVNAAMWSRLGRYIFVRGTISWNNTGGGAVLTVSLPSGLTFDTAAMPSGTSAPEDGGLALGHAQLHDAGVNFRTAGVMYDSTTTIKFALDAGSALNAGTITAGDDLGYQYMLPISGWNG